MAWIAGTIALLVVAIVFGFNVFFAPRVMAWVEENPGAIEHGIVQDFVMWYRPEVLADEPAWPVFLREVSAFLAEGADGGVAPAVSARELLTPREGEVLALAAQGLDNAGIGAILSLSVRTVERHLQNAYARLGVGGPTARAAAVAQWVREG